MNKTEIMNTYAIEQGYEDYDDLIYSADDLEDIIYHFDNITDLIQEELKKKIYKDVSESVLGNIFKCDMLEDKILNTEIL